MDLGLMGAIPGLGLVLGGVAIGFGLAAVWMRTSCRLDAAIGVVLGAAAVAVQATVLVGVALRSGLVP